MGQANTKSMWCPSPLQRRIGHVARRTVGKEAARIPWSRLQEAREKYVEWEAFALWVRAIEETEREFPAWLAKVVSKRCRGFGKIVKNQKLKHSDGQPFFWYHLERWINDRIYRGFFTNTSNKQRANSASAWSRRWPQEIWLGMPCLFPGRRKCWIAP